MAIDFADLAVRVNYSEVDKAAQALERLKTASANAEQSTNKVGVSSVAATRNMGAWSAIQAEATGHVGEHSLSIGRLGSRLESMTAQAIGANSAVGLLGATFLKFGLGDVYTVAILGGLYAVVEVYDLLTEGARKATQQMDEMTDSLVKQARAANEASIQGREDLQLIAEINAQTVKKESGIGWRSVLSSILSGVPSLSATDADSHAGRVTNAQTGIDQAAKNYNDALVEAAKKRAEEEAKVTRELERQRKIAEAIEALRDRERSELFVQQADAAKHHREDLTAARQLSPVSAGALGGGLGSITRLDVELTDLQKRFHALDEPFDAAGEAAYKIAKAMKDAADNVALFKESWKKGNITGGIAAGAGAGIGDALANFTPQGIAYQAVSAGINYIVSGLEQTALSMLGLGASATEARREQRILTDEYKAAAAAFRHDDLAAALAQDAAAFEQLMKQTHDSLGTVFQIVMGGKGALDAYTQALKDNEAQEARNQALLKQQAAEKQQYAQEDLEVRRLRATGQGRAADVLAFKEAQAREYQAAQEKAMADGVVTNSEQLYLNTLATLQNSELVAFLNGTLQETALNMVTGYKLQAQVFAAMGLGGGGLDSGIARPTLHGAPGSSGDLTTVVVLSDGTVIGKAVLKDFKRTAQRQFGDSTKWSSIQ